MLNRHFEYALLAPTAAFSNVLDGTFLKIETLDESLEWKCNLEFGIILRSISIGKRSSRRKY